MKNRTSCPPRYLRGYSFNGLLHRPTSLVQRPSCVIVTPQTTSLSGVPCASGGDGGTKAGHGGRTNEFTYLQYSSCSAMRKRASPHVLICPASFTRSGSTIL